MSEKQIKKEEEKFSEELKGAAYTAAPHLDIKYYERALDLQAKKIESQTQELARMNRVYQREVRNVKISEAISFLISVIIQKIKI
jgi:hypothetical protein